MPHPITFPGFCILYFLVKEIKMYFKVLADHESNVRLFFRYEGFYQDTVNFNIHDKISNNAKCNYNKFVSSCNRVADYTRTLLPIPDPYMTICVFLKFCKNVVLVTRNKNQHFS